MEHQYVKVKTVVNIIVLQSKFKNIAPKFLDLYWTGLIFSSLLLMLNMKNWEKQDRGNLPKIFGNLLSGPVKFIRSGFGIPRPEINPE